MLVRQSKTVARRLRLHFLRRRPGIHQILRHPAFDQQHPLPRQSFAVILRPDLQRVIHVIPQRNVLAKNFAAHAVVQARTLVVHRRRRKIVKKRTHKIQRRRRLQNRGVMPWLQFPGIARRGGFVTGARSQRVRIDIRNIRETGFRPARRIRLENRDRKLRLGMVVPREQALRVGQQRAVVTGGKNSSRCLFFFVGEFANASHRASAIFSSRLGGRFYKMIDLLVALLLEQGQQIGTLRLVPRQAARRRNHPPQRIVVRLVGGSPRRAPIEHHPHRNSQRMFGNILMNGVIRKSRQRVDAEVDLHLRFVRVAQFQQTLRQILHFRNGESPGLVMLRSSPACNMRFLFHRGHFEKATPTRTFRNREGDAPCPVPMVCIGWPLPQFGVPHSVQCSREQIASQLFQNSVVIPL